MKALFARLRLGGMILLVSMIILLGANGLAPQPTISAATAIAAPADSSTTQAACDSTQCEVVPFSVYYGVARVVLELSTPPALTFTINVNSTLGPAYIEQLQLAFYNDNYNSLPVVVSYWKFNNGLGYAGVSNSGVACSPQPSLYVALVAACDSTFKLDDPLGNPAIPISPGTPTAPSAAIMVSITGGTGGTSGGSVSENAITITALVVAPVGANVAISTD